MAVTVAQLTNMVEARGPQSAVGLLVQAVIFSGSDPHDAGCDLHGRIPIDGRSVDPVDQSLFSSRGPEGSVDFQE